MANFQNLRRKGTKVKKIDDINTMMSQYVHEPAVDSSNDTLTRNYQDDKDFDEAFKNLLRPIESITKKNQREPLQYDLIKDLDSYLNHLRESSDGSSLVFVEAALMMQNVILIYQKRVDEIVDFMMKLIGKFRAYRINQNENDDVGEEVENIESNKKKKKEKKVKFYPSFEPIYGIISPTLKIFDCKLINLSKKPHIPKIVLNANIKVDNKYSEILPYIYVENGENIGKKYDFMINWPLNSDLAVNEEFDCLINDDQKDTPLIYQKASHLPINLMDVDGTDTNDILPSTPDPIIFEQTVTKEVCIANAMLPDPANILNVSQIPLNVDDDAWAAVLSVEDNIYKDKPIVKKKNSKKEDNGVWLPSYTIGELCNQMIKLKSGIPVDPVFRELVHAALEVQKLEINKTNKHTSKDKKSSNEYNLDVEEQIKNGEELGFKGFDNPIFTNDDYNFFENAEDQEVIEEPPEDNFQSYQKNALDMKKHEQNQIDIMNEQLEMRVRVQAWHDNLRPILEEEEKRTAFDIHEYGTRLLNCFETKGEQKSFKELVGGLEQEEVARYFLSTLMMANTYNLKIINTNDGPDEMKIELLKKERHHEELQVNIGNQVNH